MKDSRYKEIMEELGMPNSRSLLLALQQVANEVAQEVHSEYKKNNKKLKRDDPKCSFSKVGCTDYWVGTKKCDGCDWAIT